MRTKGRRQSKNIEDRTDEQDQVAALIMKTRNEDKYPRESAFTPKKQKLPDKEIPVPTSSEEARSEHNKTKKIQVTPGKWITKSRMY